MHRLVDATPDWLRQDSDLFCIVYASTAVRPVIWSELPHLVERARKRNAAENLTGVLLYADGTFMQCLEGPAVALGRVYASIKVHPQHYGLLDLVRDPIQTREFAEWPMAFHAAGARGSASLAEQDALLASKLATADRPKSASCSLLSDFLAGGRNSVSRAMANCKSARSTRQRAADLDFSLAD